MTDREPIAARILAPLLAVLTLIGCAVELDRDDDAVAARPQALTAAAGGDAAARARVAELAAAADDAGVLEIDGIALKIVEPPAASVVDHSDILLMLQGCKCISPHCVAYLCPIDVDASKPGPGLSSTMSSFWLPAGDAVAQSEQACVWTSDDHARCDFLDCVPKAPSDPRSGNVCTTLATICYDANSQLVACASNDGASSAKRSPAGCTWPQRCDAPDSAGHVDPAIDDIFVFGCNPGCLCVTAENCPCCLDLDPVP